MGSGTPTKKPLVIPRSEHTISRANISPNALKVLYRLRSAGYRACLVGGGVRDLLLGREPKDFDIGTDAHPEQVRTLFRNCRLIGRRFRLAHIQFGREIIEVATFRAQHDDDQGAAESQRRLDDQGRILSDNLYGAIEEDAWRRDFTINALYYDIDNFSVLDYAGGLSDLQQGTVRLIGEPEQRYREDPVRMLRAVRFAARLGFRPHPATEAPLRKLCHLLGDIPPARLFDEVLKLFLGGYAVQTFELMRHYHLFGYLFPATERCLSRQKQHFPKTLLIHALANTDTRIAEDKPVTPAFLFAALLWEPLQEDAKYLQAQGLKEGEALQEAAERVVNAQLKHTALPRRFSLPMREIWFLQPRFAVRSGSRPGRFLLHPRFRAAYDFLLLRAACDDDLVELASWWTDFIALDETGRKTAVRTPGKPAPRNRSRRRRVARTKTPLSQTD
ncbi:MAG: polynucleotide adenylyltransferase PcnB [Candidatus Competibacteraceae bacterium]|nr:polynucleotide adenylyltransferase PcnB [Candidatus Competibacteraceae bacterium]